MTAILSQPVIERGTTLSAEARIRMEASERTPLLYSEWERSLFVHYEVSPEVLQPFVPFALDVREGKAYVSLVAFDIRRLRPAMGGAVTEWLARPIANHGFLNVRTYVVRDGEPGIFFLAEWLPNALSVWLGPRAFGLPYRYGKLDYRHEHERGELSGHVEASGCHLRYRAAVDEGAAYRPCESGTLTEFLLERYSAFTERRGVYRRFRVWHEPWPQAGAEVSIEDASLIGLTGDWFDQAKLVGANYSPGVAPVHMGRPQCVNGVGCERRWGAGLAPSPSGRGQPQSPLPGGSSD